MFYNLWVFLLSCLSFLVINRHFGVNCVYFSSRDITVTIPQDKSQLPPDDHPLVTFYAASGDLKSKELFRYSISEHNGFLSIFAPTGDVMLTKKFHESDIKKLDNLTGKVLVEDSSGQSRDFTTLQVNIGPPKRADCDLMLSELCYLSGITYRIEELSPDATVIGPLMSPFIKEMCPDYRINYTISNNVSTIKLIPPDSTNKFWKMATSGRPSRAMVNVSVACSVQDPRGGNRELVRNVLVEILDVDDQPPIAQQKEIVINLEQNFVAKNHVVTHPHLIFTDKDTAGVNNYEAVIKYAAPEEDTTLLTPNCTKYPDSRQGRNQTAIHCKVTFTQAKHFKGNTAWVVHLQLNDTTLRSSQKNSMASLKIVFRPKFLQRPPKSFNRPLVLYPQRMLKIFRTAGPFARITQARPNNASNFTVKEDPSKNIFAVTDEGVVFVRNLEALRFSDEFVNLNISWTTRHLKPDFDVLQVRIVDESTTTCNSTELPVNNWQSCSIYKTYNACLKGTACALGTGASATILHRKNSERCLWRGEINPTSKYTSEYATCTPDPKFCPDGLCDSLEQLDELICPQDCSRNIAVPAHLNLVTGRGIDMGFGVCFCNDFGGCTCDDHKVKAAKNKQALVVTQTTTKSYEDSSENSTLTRSTKNLIGVQLAKCGVPCILGITFAVLFLCGAIALIVLCWRLDVLNKTVRNKYQDDGQDMVAPLSDYMDRNRPETTPLSLNFQMTTSLTDTTILNLIKKYDKDPKWEFPRNQLTIEQTLGEGEFGRVLRAKAQNIAGQAGHTTVAVKTLKEDAREAELNDLLSEYHLLKEVSHPNVIRLLGVCTSPGGPVYVIIEFAEFGSLRNYLRKSRHVKSDSRFVPASLESPSDDLYDVPNAMKITPKEVMSFAWQICKGMAYLSEIKLVHRDLAARNVLLSGEKVCKVSDFGLTRDIYEDNAYFKRSKGRVPVKWMAPESLTHHIYTSKSDVWSFGVLIWELVTLGATPYPGIAVQNLFHLLRQGYRMERPDNCSPVLYKIMRNCWGIEPEKRPSFQQLAMQFEKMLGDGTEYLDLSNNAIHNRSYFCSPFEEHDEEKMTENNPRNYLNKSNSYEKSSASDKLLDLPDTNQNTTTQGYETPVKQKPLQTTPSNENPQEYTDMQSGMLK